MSARVQLDAAYVPCVSWASRFEGQRVIRQIRLQNTTDRPLPELVVRASIDGLSEVATAFPTVGVAPHGTLVLEGLPLELSEGELAAVTESRTGALRLEVSGPDGVVAERTLPVEILASDEWAGIDVLPELLAAFCRPHLQHATALADPMDYARADPLRVADRLRVLHDALAGHGLVSRPPSRRIRPPEACLEDGAASALDLALWMAAALEASGLHPLIAVTDTTALVGVWMVDHTLPFPVVDDPAPILRRVDAEELAFVDATPGLAYGEARKAARDVLAAGAVVVDIAAAREAGFAPLPRTAEDGTPAPPDLSEPRSLRLERWKARLLDLSMRNRLLNCKDSRATLPLLVRDLGKLEDHLHTGDRFSFEARERRQVDVGDLDAPVDCQWCGSPVSGGFSCPSCGGPVSANQGRKSPLGALGIGRLSDKVVVVDLPPGELDKRLRTLYRNARVQLEETGANTLFIAIGMLRFYEHDGSDKPRTAPLLLLPVQLTRQSVRTGYALSRTDEDIFLNPTLLQYLHQIHAFDSLRLADLPLDDAGVDVPLVLQRFRQLVQAKPRWAVVESAWITQLSFTRYMMWLDLETRTRELLQNLAVRQLLTDDDTPWPALATLPSAETLEQETDAADVLCPLDADSSQLAAVFAAEAGHSFVLQGPPGTGKSQTITNLIAHALAHGRTVLFVSEKMAALDVVHRRLQAVGLDPFCLELHSNKSRKSDVVAQLQAAFDVARERSGHDWRSHAAELQALREHLSGYVRALHETGPIGLSAFEAASGLVRYADRDDLPRVPVDLGPADALDAATFRSLQDAADALFDLSDTLDPRTSPWRWVGWTAWSPEQLPAVRTALAELDRAAAALQAMSVFDTAVDREVLDALGGLAELLPGCPGPTTGLVQGGAWAQQRARIAEWIQHGRHRQALWAGLSERWSPELLATPLRDLHARFVGWAEAFFLFAFFVLLLPRRRLGAVARGALPASPAVRDDLETALRVGAEDAWLAGVADEARALLGPYWAGRDSDFAAIERVADWSTRFREHVSRVDDGLRERLIREVTETPERFAGQADLPAFSAAVARFVAARAAVVELLTLDETAWNAPDHLAAVRSRIAAWQAEPDALRDWVAYHGAASWLRSHGLDAVLDAEVDPEDLRDVLTCSVLTWWLDTWTGTLEPLRAFHGLDHDRRIARFRELDTASRELAEREVRARLAAKVPTAGIASHGEMGVLNRELRKKRGHLAVRKLFESIPNVLQRIKPCVLMSPLSVAQYLDPALDLFDLVVFDEASQIPPWEAIGAMARGRQVVVVGDTKQLPPTSFFSRGEDDPVDEEARKDLESILDECVAIGMPALTLDWHYRSQHESLIAFSNQHYYDDRLFTFPCARANAADLGVQLFRCEGVYDKGRTRTNPVEAEALVKHVVETLSDPRHTRSVGIVTFSMPQQSLIEDLLDEARAADPGLERWFDDTTREPVFVKNLENVQGDERDVIYFSIGYGPDPDGRLSMNFGPLNRQGGERRLNVAITRARMQLAVFASFGSEAIDLARTSALGVQHLKSFLFHAEQSTATTATAGDRPPGPIASDLQQRLADAGYAVDASLGASAFRIELAVQDPTDPEKYLLGIETDGPLYAASPSARDRDRLRAEVLSRLGWSLHRVWATEWLRNPERSWKQVLAALEDARRPPEPEPEPVAVPDPAPAAVPDASPTETPAEPVYPEYVLATGLPGPGAKDQSLYASRATTPLKAAIRKVVETEGPLHVDELTRRVVAAWDVTRLTAKPRGRVLDVLRTLDPAPRVHGDFVWPVGTDPDAWTGIRVPGHARSIEHIPPEERAMAIAAVLRGAVASTRDDLARDAARLFGVTRLGTRVQEAMYEGIAVLEARGVCAVDGESVTLRR